MTTDTLHPRVVEIIGALDDAHRYMLDTVASIPEPVQNAPAPEGSWSIAQHLEHLAIVEDGVGRLMSKLIKQVAAADARETEESSVVHSIDHLQIWHVARKIVAPEMVRPTLGISASDAVSRLTASRARMIEVLKGASGLALASVSAPHPVVGPLNIYQWGIMSAHHQRRHTGQIRQLAGLGEA